MVFQVKGPNVNVANKVWLINIDISNTIRLIIFSFLLQVVEGDSNLDSSHLIKGKLVLAIRLLMANCNQLNIYKWRVFY